jgi:hypothetical protein
VTTLNVSIPIAPQSFPRGGPVDDFVDHLSHPAAEQSTSPIGAAFQCLISFGLLPLILWPARWAEFVDSERKDLLELTAWWRRRVSSRDADRLDTISRRLKPRPILLVIPWLVAGFNTVLLTTLFAQGDALDRLWNLTFEHVGRAHVLRFILLHWQPPLRLESQLYPAWIVTLCVGYGLQWHAVRSHAHAVRRLVKWTNRVARENRFTQVSTDAARVGPHWLWVLLAIALCAHHAWWGIPMALAGAMQQQYTRRASPMLRVALANQARDAFAIVDPTGGRFCAAGHCGARLPAPARFCPRCGTAV